MAQKLSLIHISSGYAGILTSVVCRVSRFRSETESEWPLAIARVDSSGLSAMPDGARPTLISRGVSFSSSMTLTVPEMVVPVTGSVSACDPLVGPVVSEGCGRRPARFDT